MGANTLKVFNKKRSAINFIFLASFLLLWVMPSMIFIAHAHATSITDGAKRFTLKNGLTVILKEDHSAPVAAVQVWSKREAPMKHQRRQASPTRSNT